MQVFRHLVYELKKGVRDFMLCTLSSEYEEKVKSKLERDSISYFIQPLKNGNINVFFGKEECLNVACKICKDKPLNTLSPEEDFILGTLLGYSLCEQCTRYTKYCTQYELKNKKALLVPISN